MINHFVHPNKYYKFYIWFLNFRFAASGGSKKKPGILTGLN